MEVVYSICNTGTDLDWSGFCSSLDLLIREEARLQNPLLHRCRNVPLAAQIKCFVLIWRPVVEVMTVHPNQAAWLGIRSSNYEKPTPFLMCGALTMGFFFFFYPKPWGMRHKEHHNDCEEKLFCGCFDCQRVNVLSLWLFLHPMLCFSACSF